MASNRVERRKRKVKGGWAEDGASERVRKSTCYKKEEGEKRRKEGQSAVVNLWNSRDKKSQVRGHESPAS